VSAIQTESTTLIPAGTWTVDPVHSSIRFDVVDTDSMMKSISGRFTDFEGTVEGGGEQSARGVVRTSSVLTDNEMRDEHLRSNDLLGTERYPEITFESSRVEQLDGDHHRILGDLTVKEVAIPVELEAKFQATGKDADGVEKTLFRVQGEIEWGPTRVEITADITAVRS
jgi:polyisoprenoid-binding protein YceI